ncbi:lytic transglycosylase domain-containing protein [Symbioplanes lichenis]|uniref:aggregation-promoting factor C-terminal-like domain-containing protein n=1 Tax=Symbioplanes lichenis TaxID=1629072 RepID=UPI0027394D88|nr:lytic transglycosylase domain-containing protein [Actinoplanes lichenis]
MDRLWTRTATRAASVALLLTGLAGGVYLGQQRELTTDAALASSSIPIQDADMQLLKERQGQHAAARALQRQAEGIAVKKATADARSAAAKARTTQKKAIEKKKEEDAKKALENGGPVPYDGPIPDSCNDFSGARQTGCALMLAAGFGIAEFPCLNQLWDHESGWNYKAENTGSGAYGIPQALPGSKMASAGADWKTNPATQIKWGLGYIEGRYNTPCGAWNNFQNNGNY